VTLLFLLDSSGSLVAVRLLIKATTANNVQGSEVRLQADLFNHATGLPFEPTGEDLTLKVKRPDGVLINVPGSDLLIDEDRPNRVFYLLDTSPMAGTWYYQFSSTGEGSVVKRKELAVLPAL
jgi:hypothetical protein